MKSLIYLMIVLLIFPVCSAPQTELTQVFCGSGGLEIVFPKIEYYKSNTAMAFTFQAYNSTGFLLDNSTTNCVFNMVDNVGLVVYQDTNVPFINGCYKTEMNNTVLSQPGRYSYCISCNNTREGGFSATELIATIDGRKIDNENNGIGIVFFIMTISLIFLALPLLKPDIAGAECEKVQTRKFAKDILNVILNRGFLAIGTYLMMLNSTVILTIADSSSIPVFNEVFRYTWILGLLGYFLLFFLAFSTIIKVMKMWQKNVEAKRMGENWDG